MKKVLSFIILMVCAVTGAWAESIGSNGSTYTYVTTQTNSKKVLTINLAQAGDLASALNNELSPYKGEANCVVITGPVNASELGQLSQFSSANLLDISGIDCSGVSNPVNNFAGNQNMGVVVPSSWDVAAFAQKLAWQFSNAFKREGAELMVYTMAQDKLVDMLKYDKSDYHIFDDITTLTFAGDVTPYNSPYVTNTVNVNNNLVIALNNANSNIKTINLENGKADNIDIFIENTNVETLNLSGLQLNGQTTLNIGYNSKGDMALKNLNLSNVKVHNVDATNLESLETINLKNANLTNINITQTDNDYSGIVISVDDPALEGKITPAPSSIWGEDVAEHIITDRSLTDNDGCSITPNEDGTVATVHAVTPGHFKALFLQYKDKFGDGVTFKFDSECNLNADDLAILAGQIDQHNNNVPFNKYYVDLYDVPVATTNIEAAITGAIGQMRTNNWQYKGLLLPKNPTTVGTTLIADRNEDATKQATCSQFIAYNNGTSTVAHVYNTDNTATATYDANVGKLESVLELHPEIGTNTTNYLVTTNSTSKVSMSALPAKATRVETVNNDMVNPNPDSPAKMYVYPSASGQFDNLVESTGVAGTANLDLLELNDAANPYDFTAINSFTDGPRVLDLRNLTSPITKAMLESLTNSKIEFILLPEDMATKEDVCEVNYSSSMTSLKAVIASTNTNLVAHVATPGSLAEARSLVTGGSIINGVLYPAKTGLTNVTLSGNLNASDINAQGKVAADGHWAASGDNVALTGLNQEQATIKSFDLEYAVFPEQYDMNFNKAGYETLTEVILPTSNEMTIIPAHCLDNIATLQNLCIPYNYEVIEDGALWGTDVNHLTTTDSKGTVIDNGPLTWTLSANLKRLGITPSPVTNAITCPIFPQNNGVTELYSLATKTPKCYKNVFPANSCDGWGGFGEGPYCRDKYYNGTNLKQSFTVLRFPSEESWKAASTDKRNDTYLEMKQFYTDINKHFTKLEQTGAVDANGDPITWPTLEEIYRTYNQASLGLTWNDWKEDYTDQGIPQVIGGQPKVALSNGVYSKSDVPGPGTGVGDYDFDEYGGWHQLVLSQATYVEPEEKIENEKIVREYEEAGWYTFCIPFNMTNEQVVRMLGVPAGDGENVVCKVYNSKGELINGDVRSDMMPDIRQLSSVTRKKGENGKNNIVMLRMTPDLVDANHAGYTAYLEITYPGGIEKHRTIDAEEYNSTSNFDERLSLIGGRPYIIKAYKRKQIVNNVDLYKIKGQNLGKYVLEHYADEFGVESSIVQNTKYPEFLEYEQLKNGKGEALTTLRFAKPFENHRIQAVRDGDNSAYLTYETTEGGETVVKKYYYTMIGQFWQQPLPKNCLYMSKGNWYRYSNVPEKIEDRYTWDPYKCVIMATEEVSGTKGAGYRDETKSVYPVVQEGTDDKLNDTFSLTFLDGRDDDDFGANGTSSRYIFGLDDDIIEFDEEGNEVTAIERLDGEDIVPAGSKVYNVAGQYVGESLNGLTKGLYIVNGKKIVVK